MPNEPEECQHLCDDAYIKKNLRKRTWKGKRAHWLKCPHCNVIWLGQGIIPKGDASGGTGPTAV